MLTIGAPQTVAQPQSIEREKPLTDPADVITLLGRFASSAALCVITIVLFVKGIYIVGIAIGIISILFQRATVRLWRRLRDERLAAEAERAAASEATAALSRPVGTEI